MQSCLRGTFATGVMKDLVLPAQHHIGDNLLETRIGFDLGTQAVAEVARFQDARQVIFRLPVESPEHAGFVKDRRGNNEHAFHGLINHGAWSLGLDWRVAWNWFVPRQGRILSWAWFLRGALATYLQ